MKPFEQLLAFNMNDGQAGAEASFPVPADGFLVIEFITATLTVGVGQKPAVAFFVQTGSAPTPGFVHGFVLFPQGTFGAGDSYAASQLVRLYPNPRTQVLFEFNRNNASGVASGNITVTGFLFDEPHG